VGEREKIRATRETRSSRFKSKGETPKKMVIDDNLHQSANALTMFNTKQCCNLVKYVLPNSGASLFFLIQGSLAVKINTAKYPITIKLQDGSIIQSTHTCSVDILWLPHEITDSHSFHRFRTLVSHIKEEIL
jgi:hypothetical protein